MLSSCVQGWETPLAMQFQGSGQLVYQFKVNLFLLLLFFFSFLHLEEESDFVGLWQGVGKDDDEETGKASLENITSI